MAKKTGWPTVSKGVFYKGFTGEEGRSPTERDGGNKKATGTQWSPKQRQDHGASQTLTAEGMRKPFG